MVSTSWPVSSRSWCPNSGQATSWSSAHKITGVRSAIETSGAHLLYLPPYSTDFNPIEMAFSKFKALIRAAEPGTLEDLRKAAANALEKFIPIECKNFFAKAGYQST